MALKGRGLELHKYKGVKYSTAIYHVFLTGGASIGLIAQVERGCLVIMNGSVVDAGWQLR